MRNFNPATLAIGICLMGVAYAAQTPESAPDFDIAQITQASYQTSSGCSAPEAATFSEPQSDCSVPEYSSESAGCSAPYAGQAAACSAPRQYSAPSGCSQAKVAASCSAPSYGQRAEQPASPVAGEIVYYSSEPTITYASHNSGGGWFNGSRAGRGRLFGRHRARKAARAASYGSCASSGYGRGYSGSYSGGGGMVCNRSTGVCYYVN
jgi:hypothetical protein